MKKDLYPAPIVLFVYKRAKHTRATLDALAKNLLAAKSELYVFCDGPKGNQDVAAVAETRAEVRLVRGFKSINIIEHDFNQGLATSVINGVTQMFSKFDRLIVLEDDLLTSHHFLTFMNRALSNYHDDQNVFSVTGHTFPASVLKIPDQYEFDTYAGYRCSSWSWGTWRDRWQKIDWGMGYFPDFIADQRRQSEFNLGGEDLTQMLSLQNLKKIDSWAIRFSFAHYVNNSRCIYPTRTLVRNIGLDGSGSHTQLDRRFIHMSLDDKWLPRNFCTTKNINEDITNNFRAIFRTPPTPLKFRIKRKMARLTYKMFEKITGCLHRLLQPRVKQSREWDIIFVNTHQSNGGAARAAFRCFSGMRTIYPKTCFLSLFSDLSAPYLYGLKKNSLAGKLASRLGVLDRLQLWKYAKRQQSIYSPAFCANPCRIKLSTFTAKLVHLHWVTSGMFELDELPELGVPIVWTLHDQWAFTGGCHYTNDCDRYTQQCGQCPALGSSDREDISNGLWLRKLDAYSKANIIVVAPSRWMSDLAKSSSLFANKRIEVIPNGLDTETFSPCDQSACRNAIGIGSNELVLLFGAHLVTDKRKGGDLLAAALRLINFSCVLLVFGEGEIETGGNPNVTVRRLGIIEDDVSLAKMYCSADVFICPSRVDNLPNTVAEAMACGVPCIGFNVGGLPEMIDHKKNGWLAKPFDPEDLAIGIDWVVNHQNHKILRAAAREKALKEYSLLVMRDRYQKLYAELLDKNDYFL